MPTEVLEERYSIPTRMGALKTLLGWGLNWVTIIAVSALCMWGLSFTGTWKALI